MGRLMVTTAIFFLLSLSLAAQTADEIVAQHISAQGGMARLKAVQSIRMTGTFDAAGMQAVFTQVVKRPMKIRFDVEVQGMTMVQAYDGQDGWQIVPFTGRKGPQPLSADDLKHLQEGADIGGPLMDYKAKGSTVVLVGKEKIDSADAYHLKVKLKDGSVREMYLDARTFLVSRIVAKTSMRGAEVEIESNISDYRQVEGLMFPCAVEEHPTSGNGPSQKIIFTKVEVNPLVDDSSFRMPVPVTQPSPAQE